MSISQEAATAIDIYKVHYIRGASGGFIRQYEWLQTATVLYLDATQTMNRDFQQRQEQKKAELMTEDATVWANLHEVCVANGIRFVVTQREDLGGKGRYFWFAVEQDLNPDSLTEWIGGGALASGHDTQGL